MMILKNPYSKLIVLQKKNVKSIESVYWIDEYKFNQYVESWELVMSIIIVSNCYTYTVTLEVCKTQKKINNSTVLINIAIVLNISSPVNNNVMQVQIVGVFWGFFFFLVGGGKGEFYSVMILKKNIVIFRVFIWLSILPFLDKLR